MMAEYTTDQAATDIQAHIDRYYGGKDAAEKAGLLSSILVNAIANGYDDAASYVASRGGLTAAGYYKDSVTPATLTDDEYFAVVNEAYRTGNVKNMGKMLNAASDKKAASVAGTTGSGTTTSTVTGGTAGGTTGGSTLGTQPTVSGGYDARGNYVGLEGAYDKNGTYVGVGTSVEAGARTNAIDNMVATFTKYGLASLAPKITEFVKMGYGADTTALLLQDTAEYKKRFAGNEARGKAGLPVLSPAEYISAEESYRLAMRNAGLPSGFYDSEDDFSKFIANDVSPTELNTRLQAAQDAIDNTDPYYRNTLQRMYGLSTGDMVAYALDPTKALPLVERRAKAIDYAQAAAEQGITVGVQGAEYFGGDIGVTQAQARQGFQTISSMMPTYEKLTQIYGETPQAGTLGDLQSAVFGGAGAASAQERIRKAGQAERGAFSGSSGVGAGSLGSAPLAGAI